MVQVKTNLRVTLTGLLAASALALVPAAADAVPYEIDHCQTRAPSPQPATPFGTITGQSADDCSAPGGGLHVTVIQSPGPAQLTFSGDLRQVVLAIPADRPNIQIERVISTFSMPAQYPPPGGSGNGFGFLTMYNGDGVRVYNQTGMNGARLNPTIDISLPPHDRALTWETLCGGAPCTFTTDATPTAGLDANILNVYGNHLFLNEGVVPTLAVTGGTLVGTGAKRGRLSLGFDAGDTDSGVESVAVTLGGTPVASAAYTCLRNDWSACPRDEKAQLLQVDTTKVPDGDQELIVTVTDAAKNVLTRSLGTIAVANAPGAAGVAGGPVPGVPNGADASRLAKITAHFTTTSRRSRTVHLAAQPSIRGTLMSETGQPITGATVAVLARERRSGVQSVQIATAQTGADGGYTLKLPGGPSRTISLAYTAFSGDAKPASVATLRTTVRALVSARISPRPVRPGQRLTLSGRLALLPRRNVEVSIQARDGHRWRTVDSVRTTSTGAFHWPYRFKPSSRGRTFAFRARVASQIYPFAAGNSKALTVRVR